MRPIRLACAALALSSVLFAAPSRAADPQDVRIPWLPGRSTQFSDSEAAGELAGKLFRPPGDAPVPFVVHLHGCGGLKVPDVRHWADVFARRGVGVLMVDSFATRGIQETCGEGTAPVIRRRADDAESALAWLKTQPFVRADRLALLGQSQGGTAALVVGNRNARGSADIVGVLAMYPSCQFALNGKLQYAKPVVVQIGDEDTWTPVAPCEQLKAANPAAIELIVYPGARHSFDNPGVYRLALGKYPVGEHAASRDKAHQRAERFIDELLR